MKNEGNLIKKVTRVIPADNVHILYIIITDNVQIMLSDQTKISCLIRERASDLCRKKKGFQLRAYDRHSLI